MLTQPTTFKPLFTKAGSVGLFPVTISSNRTPKLYTSDFSVALPLCRYSVSSINSGSFELLFIYKFIQFSSQYRLLALLITYKNFGNSLTDFWQNQDNSRQLPRSYRRKSLHMYNFRQYYMYYNYNKDQQHYL